MNASPGPWADGWAGPAPGSTVTPTRAPTSTHGPAAWSAPPVPRGWAPPGGVGPMAHVRPRVLPADRRLLAWLVDVALFYALLQLAATQGLWDWQVFLAEEPGRLPDLGRYLLTALAASWVIDALVPSLIEGSPGKRLLGGRVVRRDGARASVLRHHLRWPVRGVLSSGLLLLVNAVVVARSDGHRGMHDRVVGTVVARL